MVTTIIEVLAVAACVLCWFWIAMVILGFVIYHAKRHRERKS